MPDMAVAVGEGYGKYHGIVHKDTSVAYRAGVGRIERETLNKSYIVDEQVFGSFQEAASLAENQALRMHYRNTYQIDVDKDRSCTFRVAVLREKKKRDARTRCYIA